MMKLVVAAAGVFALWAVGCGGDDGGGGTGGAGGAPAAGGGGAGGAPAADGGGAGGGGGASGDLQHSCDSPNNGARMCAEWAYPAQYADLFSGAQADCESEGNTFGETCDATGAIGGCRTTDTGAPGITVTTWVYTGTEAEVTAYCTSLTATFISPP